MYQRSLDGVRMRPVSTAARGEINSATQFSFSQQGDTITAEYAGGSIRLGFLIGIRAGSRLAWRYVQLDQAGNLDGGHSLCELSRLDDGRLRLVEHFNWDSREGSGSNLLEQIA